MSAPFEVKQNQHPPILATPQPRSTQVPVNIPDFQVEQRKWNPEVTSFFFFFRIKKLHIVYTVLRPMSRKWLIRAGNPTGSE